MRAAIRTSASHVSGPAVSGTQHNHRTGSVDSQMTSLSGASDLTNASHTVSNDGIADAVRVGPLNLSFADRNAGGAAASGGGGRRGAARRDLAGAGGSAHDNSNITGSGQVPVCTLCDQASSDFSCRACGGLTFCEKCALSLHTNKFLGSHQLQNVLDPNDKVLGSDLAIRRATLDAERAAREIYSDDARRQRAAAEEAQLQGELQLAAAAGRDRAREDEERRRRDEQELLARGPKLDMKALAADRSVLSARAKELRSCIDILRRLGLRLAEEQASCVDATRTAGDAVRKKFDLLRSLINQKESAFLAVVQEAGKTRHDAGAAQRTAVAAAVAETVAFADNLDLQLQRLEGNHAMFNDSRAGLMEDTRLKITQVDGHIHKFEGVVQEVRDIPLGVVVPVDGIVTALQMLQPPERTIGSAEVAMLNAADAMLPVPADSFERQLGVQHFRSVAGDGGAAPPNRIGGSNANSSRGGLNSSQRSDSPSYASGPGAGSLNRSSSNFAIREIQPTRRAESPVARGGGGNNSVVGVGFNSAAAAALRGSVPRGSYPGGGSQIPPEVRELRRAINAQSASNPGTPTSRMTPTRQLDSPMRRSGSASFVNNSSSINNATVGGGGMMNSGGFGGYSIPGTNSPMRRTGSQQPQFTGRVGGVTPGGIPGLGQPVSWPVASQQSRAQGTPPRNLWR